MIAECSPEIALVHPPAISKRYLHTKFMPYGMAVLYAFLKEHDIPVIQYDFLMEYLFDSPDDINYHGSNHSFSETDFFAYLEGSAEHPGLADFTRKYGDRITRDAMMYGFSIVAYHQYWASLLLAKYLRQQNPDAIVVFGGPFITIKPAEALVRLGQAHYWIKGSGEIPLFLLYKLLRNNSSMSLEEVPGLIFKKGNLVHQGPRSRFPAEEERCPDFQGLDLDSYRYNHPVTGDKTFFIPYRLSKGCPSRCSFCTGRLIDSYDYKSPEKVISDLEFLCQKYASTNFQFADASVNGNPHQLSVVCDLIQSHLREIRWYAYARVSGFDEQLLGKVKKAGCFSLFWGIESAHQPTVNLLGKRFKVERMYEVLDYSISLGMRNFIHIMYNTPHESKADIQAFQYLVYRYVFNPEVIFLPQRFLLEPQSSLQENPEAFGISGIKPIEKGIFEREEYLYSEAAGVDYQGVNSRKITHQKELFECLELIRLMNWRRDSGGLMKHLVPARFLVHLIHFWRLGVISGALYDKLFRPLTIPRQSLKEQL